MKKIIVVVTTLVLAGVLYISPAKDQKEQPKQVAKDAQTQIMLRMDPGTGIG
ncbi:MULTISPECIES: hypothetical protein [Bacillus cereus group]|uniref:hypothetical protein n=1 Tax=Bacillus cereus group TaxID=86661 RepID=UPI0002EDE956|nr:MULTISPECIES: hypothetical protein [Bacillus cereus group]MDA2666557.1 hypothetical protein [Bacillus cereus group sp. Bc032]MDA2677259.1 hypothetical protein [Bacillus cereus group sp. Bc031]MDA2682765.1 hypothetical protein [Bacillus cereus group sp. Bc029]MDA2688212.1 hypothetical protein [Bacillus cereus group sp. Bc030]MDA2743723.1 hypothetical protein [Bacillus cereus group sp. Bc011]